jgi:tetratricopeptide (TPR) repeat protein
LPTPRELAEQHHDRALDFFAAGNYEHAIAEYQAALAADPTFTDALHGLARAYQDLERTDDAIAAAKQIIALDPDDVLAHTCLSVLYQKKNMIAEAEAEAGKARILGWKQELKEQKR